MADEMMPNSTSTDFGAASSSNSQPSHPSQPQPQQLQFHALPQSPLSPSTMRSCLWAICVSGVLLNVLVFHKYRRSRCRHSPSVRSSLQLLCVMAGADTLSLLALMLALGSRHFAKLHFGERHWLLGAICKLDLFLIHASSAFGIWCWFILSSVRYLAIHHPYTHLRLHKEPLLTVLCVAVCCCVLELWIPFDITYLDDLGVCGETLPEQLGKALQLTEILWTYFLPLSLITVLDLKVLCCPAAWSNPVVASEEMPQRELLRSVTTESGLETSSGESLPSPQPYTGQTQPFLTQHKMSTASGPRSSKSKRRAQQLHILRRFLCISIIELGMNLPNYLIRLYLTLVSEEALEQMDRSATFLWAQDISQLLYFAQFAMNALYLVAINYVTAPTARRSSPQQLSIAAVFAHQPSHQQSFMGIRSSVAASSTGIPRIAAAAGGGGC